MSSKGFTGAYVQGSVAVLRQVAGPFLVALAFIAAAEYFVGWRSIVYPWRFVDSFVPIGFAALLLGLTYVLRAVRVYRFFRFKAGFGLCLRLMLQHNLLLNLLPMRAGEFAFPVLMNRYFDVPATRSVPALLWLRVLDLHALALIVLGILAFIVPWQLAAVAAAAWIVGLAFAFGWSQRIVGALEGKDRKPLVLVREALSAAPRSGHELAESWLLTQANWLLKLFVFAWIIQLFAAEEYTPAFAGALGGEISSMLPIHGFAQFGTYEAGVVAGMRSLGTNLHDALTGAANLHLLMLGVAVIGGVLSLLIPTSLVPKYVRSQT